MMNAKQINAEFDGLFTELTSAITRSKFTKARRLRTQIQNRIWEVEDDKALQAEALNALEKRLDEASVGIPVRERKAPKKSKRQLQREAHERFLYRNNTYHPGS